MLGLRWLDYNPTVLANLMEPPPDQTGGGGGGGSGSGGATGTKPVSKISVGTPIGESGGVYGFTYYLMVPVQDSNSGTSYLGFYDASDYNDLNDGSYYAFRQEDVISLRVPTVRRVGLIYRDLGLVTLMVTLTGTNDNGAVVSKSVVVKLGTAGASGALLTKLVDVTLTAYRPQLMLTRAPAGGPVSIISVTMVGEVEDVSL